MCKLTKVELIDIIEEIRDYRISKIGYEDTEDTILQLCDINNSYEEEKDCTTCKNAYIKDGVYLICDIDGIQNDVVKNCENYEGGNNNA